MVKQKLHEHSPAIVHRTKHRTRLRVPKKFRVHESMRQVQTRIEKIPGVQSVVINSDTGSVLVQHDEKPGLLDEVCAALEESAPELLMGMLVPGGEEAEVGLGMLTTFLKKCFASGTPREALGNGGGGPAVIDDVQFAAGGISARKALPLALIGAGAWKMLQEEALLGGLAPLALFYYGFDMYWKFQQEDRTKELERIAEMQQLPDVKKSSQDRA